MCQFKSKATKRRPKSKKLPPLPPIMSDEESVEFRRRTAAEEKASVIPMDLADDFRGTYRVTSTQWDEPYEVEIRDLTGHMNSCGCMDFQMNRLGTCKHIERVFQAITHRRKGKFRAATYSPSPVNEIFVDSTLEHPRIRRLPSDISTPKLSKALDPFFDSEGLSVGPLPEALAGLTEAVEALSPRLQKQVRISRHMTVWADQTRRRAELDRLRRNFEADVAAGKRTDNPVNLPLYPYQKEGMRHLAFLGRAMLADEMGLGKTVQAIAAAELLRGLGKVSRVLIVCPASLKGEWSDQLAQFTGKTADPVFGPRHDRLKLYGQPHEYLLCNYEQIRTDVDDINHYFAPDLIVLDEAQRIKNWPTKTAKTIKRLQSPYAFVLTGTPLENRVQELYSLAEFVDPHLFGTIDRFNREFMSLGEDEKSLVPRDLPALHRRVTAIMLRRRKGDIDDDLPGREEKFYRVSMTPEQQLRYDDYEYPVGILLKIALSRKLTKEEMERLQLLLACMRMVCDTPYILDKECRDCPKLEELTDLLDELLDDPDAKILVFSEWVRMLDLVKERLEEMGVGYTEHTGKIPQKQRREHIRHFKEDPDCRVFLSSESGGVGLNLQNANIVINLDLPWNPAKLEQRIARAWRKHQKRSVRVLNLVTANSIEERMIYKLAYKSALADSVLDGADFEEARDGKPGKESFISRLREVMGEPKSEDIVSASEPKASTPAKATLADALLSRHGDRVRGIEQSPRGVTVVVAEPGAGYRDLEDTARRATSGQVEVISTETLAAIRRLQQLGLLTLTGPLETRHAADGYESLTVPLPAETLPLRYPDAARSHWKSAEGEYKAAKALAELGMTEQAVPHFKAALEKAKESLSIYFTSESEVEDFKEIPPEETKLFKEIDKLLTPPLGPKEGLEALRLCDKVVYITSK